MKILLTFSVAALLAVNIIAQTPPVRTGAPSSAVVTFSLPTDPIDVEIRDQADSPLRLEINDEIKNRFPGSPVSLRNVGTAAIAAMVIRVDVGSSGSNSMMIFGNKGLAPGQNKVIGLPGVRSTDAAFRAVAYVDFVRFIDGQTWGSDTLGRSSQIGSFIEGRDRALTLLAQLVAGQDDTEIRRAFDVYSGSSFGEPNAVSTRVPSLVNFGVKGYESIVMVLRRLPRDKERGEDLARQLELAARK